LPKPSVPGAARPNQARDRQNAGRSCKIVAVYFRVGARIQRFGIWGAYPAGEYYRDDASFLEQTKNTLIHDTVDGRKGRISLGLSIDLLMPCHWDFVGSLVTILKAIGGDLHPPRPFACCSRNLGLSPLCDRVRTISNTLRSFWRGSKRIKDIDRDVLASLGPATTVKRWLAASLDKTIRLQLEASSDFWLTFS